MGYKDELIKGLVWLSLKNKGNLNPDPLYAAYHFTHPELIEWLWALGYSGEKVVLEEVQNSKKED